MSDRQYPKCIRSTLTLSILPDDLQKLLFSECLIAVSTEQQPDEAHEMHFTAKELETNLYAVSLKIKSTIANKTIICNVVSLLDERLQLIEEKHSEKLEAKNNQTTLHLQRRSLYIYLSNEKGKMAAIRSEILENQSSQRFYAEFNANSDFLLEGGSLLLMRYLVAKKFIGSLELSGLNLTGEAVVTVYSCQLTNENYSGQNIECVEIERSIMDSSNQNLKLKSTFLLNGRIIKHHWKSSYSDQIIEFQFLSGVPITNNLHKIQMLSWKMDRISSAVEYFENNLGTWRMLRDLLLILIQFKPENLVDFIIEFLSRFVATSTLFVKSNSEQK